MRHLHIIVLALALLVPAGPARAADDGGPAPERGKLVYLVSDLRIPFWDILWRGIRDRAGELGYAVTVKSAENDPRQELAFTIEALQSGIAGLIVSPTTSSACATILKLADKADVPVVIADIGTDAGDYVAYISSDNRGGAYGLGRILADALKRKGWDDGRVGIIAIPQKRANGQARTAGFMRAMEEAGIRAAGIAQQVDFSYQETYGFAADLIAKAPDLRALWLQGSDRYRGALDAIRDAGRTGEILLITFDAEPEFLEMIRDGALAGAGMQQPFLMGEKAVEAMHHHLSGEPVDREQKLPVLAISADNLEEKLPIIRRNVLGLSED